MKKSIADYHIIRKIGQGSFGEISEAQIIEGNTRKSFAIKQISQKQIVKLNKLHEPFIQKQILLKFNKIYPEGFVNLYQAHSDSENIYMVLQLCEGGSLDKIIPKLSELPNKDQVIKKLIVKMVLILEQMHKARVVHRDLKPSNFLFKKDGTIKLADFGTAYAPIEFFQGQAQSQIAGMKQMAMKKKNQKMNQEDLQLESLSPQMRRATFVGTPLYMAPQLISQDHCGPQADLWALGCIIYELIHTKTPFHDDNEGTVWKKILSQDFSKKIQPSKQNTQKISDFQLQCQFLTSALLIKQREKRLGYGEKGYEELKSHSFFKGVEWEKMKNQPIEQIAELIEQYEMLKSVESTQSKTSQQDKVLFSGIVTKKMYFGNYKQRLLALYSFPKLLYYDAESGQKKGQIVLNKDTPITAEGTKGFTITTDKKTYYFKSSKAAEWIQMLKYSIVNAYY